MIQTFNSFGSGEPGRKHCQSIIWISHMAVSFLDYVVRYTRVEYAVNGNPAIVGRYGPFGWYSGTP